MNKHRRADKAERSMRPSGCREASSYERLAFDVGFRRGMGRVVEVNDRMKEKKTGGEV